MYYVWDCISICSKLVFHPLVEVLSFSQLTHTEHIQPEYSAKELFMLNHAGKNFASEYQYRLVK